MSELLATEVRENGPWTVDEWGTDELVLQSQDFTHDVTLRVSGDFGTQESKRAYIYELCRRLNAMNPVANVEVTGLRGFSRRSG